MKTLAIRLEDELHAQLSVLAQLSGSTVTEEIRQAIAAHIERKKAEPELTAKADGVLADIEAAADRQRTAISSLFASNGTEGETSAVGKKRASRTRGEADASVGD